MMNNLDMLRKHLLLNALGRLDVFENLVKNLEILIEVFFGGNVEAHFD
jgi:hypothetical protein